MAAGGSAQLAVDLICELAVNVAGLGGSSGETDAGAGGLVAGWIVLFGSPAVEQCPPPSAYSHPFSPGVCSQRGMGHVSRWLWEGEASCSELEGQRVTAVRGVTRAAG